MIAVNLAHDALDGARTKEDRMKNNLDNNEYETAKRNAHDAAENYWRSNMAFVVAETIAQNMAGQVSDGDVVTLGQDVADMAINARVRTSAAAALMEFYALSASGGSDPRERWEQIQERDMNFDYLYTDLRDEREQAPDIASVDAFESALWVGE